MTTREKDQGALENRRGAHPVRESKMTEQTNHTPGPWRGNETPDRDGLVRDGGGHVVAQCFPEYFGVEGAKANARLIAAAPEMAGVLRNLVCKLEIYVGSLAIDEDRYPSLLKMGREVLERAGAWPERETGLAATGKKARGRSMDGGMGR